MNKEELEFIRENFRNFYWGDSSVDSIIMGNIESSYLTFVYDSKIDTYNVYKTIFDEVDQSKTYAPFPYNTLREQYYIIKNIMELVQSATSFEQDEDVEKAEYTLKFINDNFRN